MSRTIASSLWCSLVAVAMLSAALSGCESESPAMRRARITREEAFGRTMEHIKSIDVHRAENLQADAEIFEDKIARNKQATADNLKTIADWVPNEVKEWNSKQAAYQEAIRHQLEGKPESIENTVPHFIY